MYFWKASRDPLSLVPKLGVQTPLWEPLAYPVRQVVKENMW